MQCTHEYHIFAFQDELAEIFFSFNESDEPDVNDILLSREQAQIPVICVEKVEKKGPEGGLPSENS
jgi:hypothetical protein